MSTDSLPTGRKCRGWSSVLRVIALATIALMVNGCSPHQVRPRVDPYTDAEIQEIVSDLHVGQHVSLWTFDGRRKQGDLTCVDTEMLCFGRVRVLWADIADIQYNEGADVSTGEIVALVGVTVIVVTFVLVRAWASALGSAR